MESEWNLSSETFTSDDVVEFPDVNTMDTMVFPELLKVKDVREFIKRLKDTLKANAPNGILNITHLDVIDKLAGEKLV